MSHKTEELPPSDYYINIKTPVCVFCGKTFKSWKINTKYCSPKCARETRKANRTLEDIQKKKQYDKYRRTFLRMYIVDHYGGKCACCGEQQIEFLAIDHIDGGGSQHRKEIGNASASNFAKWLWSNNLPQGYRILCHNCNFVLGHYNHCPHTLKEESGRI